MLMAPIHQAAGRGDLEEVMSLVQKDPGVVNSIDVDRFRGGIAHHYAAGNGYVEVACYLLDQGADINAKDRHGWPALHRVGTYGHMGMVQLLVSRRGNPTITGSLRVPSIHGYY